MKALITIDDMTDKSSNGVSRWLVKTTDGEYYTMSQWTEGVERLKDCVKNSTWLVDYRLKPGEKNPFRNIRRIQPAEDLSDRQRFEMRMAILESKMDYIVGALAQQQAAKPAEKPADRQSGKTDGEMLPF